MYYTPRFRFRFRFRTSGRNSYYSNMYECIIHINAPGCILHPPCNTTCLLGVPGAAPAPPSFHPCPSCTMRGTMHVAARRTADALYKNHYSCSMIPCCTLSAMSSPPLPHCPVLGAQQSHSSVSACFSPERKEQEESRERFVNAAAS